jgi:hypothetical protein
MNGVTYRAFQVLAIFKTDFANAPLAAGNFDA